MKKIFAFAVAFLMLVCSVAPAVYAEEAVLTDENESLVYNWLMESKTNPDQYPKSKYRFYLIAEEDDFFVCDTFWTEGGLTSMRFTPLGNHVLIYYNWNRNIAFAQTENGVATDICSLEEAYEQGLIDGAFLDRLNGNQGNFGITRKGDINRDFTVDIADIMELKHLIMNGRESDVLNELGDMDESGKLDVGDIMAIKNIIMSA